MHTVSNRMVAWKWITVFRPRNVVVYLKQTKPSFHFLKRLLKPLLLVTLSLKTHHMETWFYQWFQELIPSDTGSLIIWKQYCRKSARCCGPKSKKYLVFVLQLIKRLKHFKVSSPAGLIAMLFMETLSTSAHLSKYVNRQY